jgi:hypothetical protein
MLTAVHFDEQVLMDGSGHHANGEVGVRPELGALVCKPSTRYARIPPGPPSEEGGKLPTRNSKEAFWKTERKGGLADLSGTGDKHHLALKIFPDL